MENLSEVREYLSNINFINSGGCAIAALAMHRWLQKNKSQDKLPVFVYLYRDSNKEQYLNNKRVLRDGNGIASSCSHVCLSYGNKYFDVERNIYLPDYEFVQHIKEEPFIKASINNVDDWNKLFGRKNISEIAKALDIDLSDLEMDVTYTEKYKSINRFKLIWRKIKLFFSNFNIN